MRPAKVAIQRDVIALILSHALKESRATGYEVLGWLLGFFWKDGVYVCDAVPCTRYKVQTRFRAEADPLEEAELAGRYPRNVGIVGLYHSHPFSLSKSTMEFREISQVWDIFHSLIDDSTIRSRSGKHKNYLSLVTNGIEYSCFVPKNGGQRVKPRLADSISYKGAMDVYFSKVGMGFEESTRRKTALEIIADLGRKLTQHIEQSLDLDLLEIERGHKRRHYVRIPPFADRVEGPNHFRLSKEGDQVKADVQINLAPTIYTSKKDDKQILESMRNEIIDDATYLLWKPFSSQNFELIDDRIKHLEIGLGNFEIDERGPLPLKIYKEPERSIVRKRES